MMIKYLIEKEFKQFFRNSFMPRLVILMPCVMLLVLPWAANQEIKNINVAVLDNDHSSLSQRLTAKVIASPYFNLVANSFSYQQAMEEIERGEADLILEIPVGFERNLTREGASKVLISANAVNGTKGGLGSGYMTQVVAGYAEELRAEQGGQGTPPSFIEIVQQHRFNPSMDYKVYMIPALMVMLMTLICGFLPALNIVSEKEKGTIEQINVSPVPKLTFIMAKLIPYWIIGFVVLTLCFAIAWLVYGLLSVGSLATIYVAALIYVLAVSGFGLVISNHSGTMQQAMFVIFFFTLVFILLSGLFTPVSSMPLWAQTITIVNPLKPFILIMRQVYLKGSGMADLLPEIATLAVFAVVSNVWAIVSYRKR